jgi:hypothetical protein
VGVDGTKDLSVSNDARWDKRSAGKQYDSLSGAQSCLAIEVDSLSD